MTYKIFPAVILAFISIYSLINNPTVPAKTPKTEVVKLLNPSEDSNIESVYSGLNANEYTLPNLKSFTEALKGFYFLKEKGLVKKNILTLVDFSLSSNTKRLWVIDLDANVILFNSLVAHGKNSGEEFANSFSNTISSFKSSLGFYTISETYKGKHGVSLRLDGLEKGINNNARVRGVVIHSANYVSNSFIEYNKTLGRSEGCLAIPQELLNGIVSTVKDKSCLYVYHPSRNLNVIPDLFF